MRAAVLPLSLIALSGVSAALSAAEPGRGWRVDFSTAPGIDEIEFGGFGTVDVPEDGGAQIQVAWFREPTGQGWGLAYQFGLGFANHEASEDGYTLTYSAFYGLAQVGGGYAFSENFTLSARLGLGLGFGDVSADDNGQDVEFTDTDAGTYTRIDVKLGAYYSFAHPGFQLGLELGQTSFAGNVQDTTFDENVEFTGSGTSIGLTLGYSY